MNEKLAEKLQGRGSPLEGLSDDELQSYLREIHRQHTAEMISTASDEELEAATGGPFRTSEESEKERE